jgi:hypothetical protein
MRCLEAAAQPGAHGVHNDGHAAAVLQSAQKFAEWVLGEKKPTEGVNALL